MLNAEHSIVDEVEAAIRGGSAEKCLETARRVTDLFLASGNFNEEQVRAVRRCARTTHQNNRNPVSRGYQCARCACRNERAARADCPSPPSVVRRLARNDEITIAAPVLQESARLGAEDLVEIAQTKAEPHLLAVAGRWWLTEIVTDALLARRYPSVSRRIVSNPGARVSASGFAIVLAQAESDPELAVEAGIRVDVPSELRHQLLRNATEAVRTRLLERAPPHLFEETATPSQPSWPAWIAKCPLCATSPQPDASWRS